MKNADMPAMPIIDDEQSFPIDGEKYGKSLSSGRFAVGMTKREIVAMHMMAHLMPNQNFETYAEQAESAVIATDALLAELERTK